MSIVDRLKVLGKDKVKATKHLKEKLDERGLSMDYLKEMLFDFDKLRIENRQDSTYVLVYELSKKYHLVIFIAINNEIRIVSAFKTSKKIQKLIEKFGGYYMVKKIPV